MSKPHRNTIVPVFQVGIEIVPDGDLEGFRVRLQKMIESSMSEVLGTQVVHTGYDPHGYEKVRADPEVYIVMRDGSVVPGDILVQDYERQAEATMSEEYDDNYESKRIMVSGWTGVLYYPNKYPLNLIDMVTVMEEFVMDAIKANSAGHRVGAYKYSSKVEAIVAYQHFMEPQKGQSILVTLITAERLPEVAE